MDPTTTTLQAALAFANAMIEHGEAMPADYHEMLTFGHHRNRTLIDSLKGHPERLTDVRDQLQQALDTLSPVKA